MGRTRSHNNKDVADNSQHFLSVYRGPDSVLKSWHVLHHLILRTRQNDWENILRQCEEGIFKRTSWGPVTLCESLISRESEHKSSEKSPKDFTTQLIHLPLSLTDITSAPPVPLRSLTQLQSYPHLPKVKWYPVQNRSPQTSAAEKDGHPPSSGRFPYLTKGLASWERGWV